MSGKVDGTGGYPSGVVEVHGDPATGKSFLFAMAIAESQRRQIRTILADAEGRWDYDFAAKQGVDAELLRTNTFYPETVEEFATKAMEILQTFGKVTLVLDSMGILSTVQEKGDAESGEGLKADQGRKAQKIRATMRVLTSEVRKTGSLILISNHMMSSPGMYIPRSTPGGLGLPFQANVRLELTKPTTIKLEKREHPIGVQLHAECTKNSVIPPFGACDLDLYFASGLDKFAGLLALAKDIGVIEQRGGYYYYQDKSFRADDFGALCTTTDLLKDTKWDKPYWVTGQLP